MANGLRPIELTGAHIKLRSLARTDAEKLFAGYFASTEAARFLGRRAHKSVAQTRAVLEQRCRWDDVAPMVAFGWIIASLSDDEPVGILYSMVKDGTAEIHYGVSVSHWNRGLATEAVQIAGEWLISKPTVSRVCTAVDCDNVATRRVPQKAGFKEEGRLTSRLILPAFGDAARDAVSYCRVKP